jgi:multiple sugar transport system permease protein
VLTNSANMQTLPSGLGTFLMGDVFLWGPLMAVSFVTTLPPIILFIIVQRFVVSGMTLGSVKG